MPAPDRRTVRRLQRRYLEQWVDLLAELTPDAPRGGLRAAAHATFGLLNSTPHSAGALDRRAMARLRHGMAQPALDQGSTHWSRDGSSRLLVERHPVDVGGMQPAAGTATMVARGRRGHGLSSAVSAAARPRW